MECTCLNHLIVVGEFCKVRRMEFLSSEKLERSVHFHFWRKDFEEEASGPIVAFVSVNGEGAKIREHKMDVIMGDDGS